MQDRFNITTKKYIEDSSVLNEFTSVYSHIPESIEVAEVRGRMYSMVQIKGPKGLDAINANNTFLDALEGAFFGEDPTPIPQVLERSIKIALYAINEYFEKEGILDDIIFDFCCAVVKEDVVYIGKVEDGFIYLIRNGKVLDLGRSLRDIANPKVIEIGSGIIQESDKLVLTNSVADGLVTDWQLLSTYSENEINRMIAPSEEVPEKMAFLLVEISRSSEANILRSEIEPTVDAQKITEEKANEYVPASIPEESFNEKALEEEPQIEDKQENPQDEKQIKKNDIFGTVIDKADALGVKILSLLKIAYEFILKQAKYVIDHREEILAYIKAKVVLAYAFLNNLVSKYILKKPTVNLQDKNFYHNELEKANTKGKGNLISSITKTNTFGDRKNTKSKVDRRMLVPIALVGFLFFFILFLVIKSHIDYSNRLSKFNTIQANIQTNLSEAKATTDYAKIDSLTSDTSDLVSQAKALNINNSLVDNELSTIQGIDDTSHNIIRPNYTVLSDLSLQNGNIKPDNVSIGSNALYVISSATGDMYSLNLNSPSSGTKVSSTLFSAPVSAFPIDDGTEIVYDKNNGVLSIDPSGNISQIAGLTDIKNVASITTFDNNIYFLDPNDQVIYKSVPVGGSYSIASNYITSSSLTDAESIAIDGNVFVASPTQDILRFYGGQSTNFSMNGMAQMGKSFGPITQVFDTKYLSNMYILDPQNNRVVVLQKPTGNGQTYTYSKQYVFPDKSSITSIAVDNTEKTMYVLSGSKVLRLALN